MSNSQGATVTLNTAGAAAYLGLAESTLEKMRVTGGNIPFVKIGRKVLYRISDLEAYLARNVVHSTSELRAA